MHEKSPIGSKLPRRSSRDTSVVDRCFPMHTKDQTKPRSARRMICERKICAGLYCCTCCCTGCTTPPYTRDITARVLDVSESAVWRAATVSGEDRDGTDTARAAGSAAGAAAGAAIAFALSTRAGRAGGATACARARRAQVLNHIVPV